MQREATVLYASVSVSVACAEQLVLACLPTQAQLPHLHSRASAGAGSPGPRRASRSRRAQRPGAAWGATRDAVSLSRW